MKCKLLSGFLAVAMPFAAVAASDFYVNDSFINCPPQIPPQVDATNFVNNNYFSINFTNLLSVQPYRTANTLNFTNNGQIVGNYGFQFDTGPSGSGTRRMANNFKNAGSISVATTFNTNSFFGFFFSSFFSLNTYPKLFISATNISMRSSTNTVGLNGHLLMTGKNVDLNRANITMDGFADNQVSASSSNFFFTFNANTGVFDNYWGLGTTFMNPVVQFAGGVPTTPSHFVQTTGGFLLQQLSLPAAVTYVRETIIGTNRNVQVVFLSDTNAAIHNNVYFPNTGNAVVEWFYPYTNLVTGVLQTNYLYLLDDFGSFFTNGLAQNFSGLSPIATFVPLNYAFVRGGPYNTLFGGATAPGSAAGVFDSLFLTSEYSAYSAILSPTTQIPGNIPGGVITNLPGRIEITADGVLDLTRTKINGLNYVRLKATNHIASSELAQIASPYSDISLTSTNGSLSISNLLAPTLPRSTGVINLWSGRWTNNNANFLTTYSVLFVDSKISPTAPAIVQDLALRSTNTAGGSNQMFIGDVLNVQRVLSLNTERLTITTNYIGSPTPSGQINLLSTDIVWSSALPRLQYLTNRGSIKTLNSVFFGGARTTPHFTSNYNESYEAFVNSGGITNEGSLIWAKYFENTGSFSTGLGFGSVNLQSVNTRLTNGSVLAANGDITISTGSLIASNHVLQAGRELILTVTNLLTDFGVSNANTWAVGKGFSMPVKPTNGTLVGTTINETAGATENLHTWAGANFGGTNSAGYLTNAAAAIGKVILNGTSTDSLFTFTGATSNNAIYIDYLDLRNFATNIDNNGNVTALNINSNIIVYYAQAVAGNISVAERINHANGDRLQWVSAHAGIYSTTNLVYPDGSTNAYNIALVQSENLDTDNDGLVNAEDPTPLMANPVLAVAITNVPAMGAVVSWRTLPNSANTIYYKSSLAGGSWVELTNVNVGPSTPERTSIFDPMSSGGSRVYRVKVTPPQP